MANHHLSARIRKAANQQKKEREYWQQKLSGFLVRSSFPVDYGVDGEGPGAVQFHLEQELGNTLIQLVKGSHHGLHIYLVAGLILLLARYTWNDLNGDVMVSTPIYRQDSETGDYFLNTVLPLRSQVTTDMTFKQLLLQIRDTLTEALENQNYPVELLAEQLGIAFSVEDGEDFPLFDVGILLENIQNQVYLQRIKHNIVFSFMRKDQVIRGVVRYNPRRYTRSIIQRIAGQFQQLLSNALGNLDSEVFAVDILPEQEKRQLLCEFNSTSFVSPRHKTLHELFEEQVKRTPGFTAVICNKGLGDVYNVLHSSSLEDAADDDVSLLEPACFRKEPYIFKFEDSVPRLAGEMGEKGSVLLRTRKQDHAAVNQATCQLLDEFTGQQNLKSIFDKIKEKATEYFFCNIGESRKSSCIEIDTNTTFKDFILFIKQLVDSHLLKLVDYRDHVTGKNSPDIPVKKARSSLGPGQHAGDRPGNKEVKRTWKTITGSSTKSPVLLLGDTVGTATTGLLYLASYLRRNGIEAYCVWNDMNRRTSRLKQGVEKLLQKFRPRLVGVSMKWFPHIARVLEICKIVKAYDSSIEVVVGGNTASFYWKEISQYQCVDVVIRGDGEVPLLKTCLGDNQEDIPNYVYKRKGKIIKTPITYVQDETNSSDIFLSHLGEIFAVEDDPYFTSSFYINTGKGCAQQCFYCAGCLEVQRQTFNRVRPFLRGAAEVRKDLKAAREYTSTFMFDFDLPAYDSLDYYKSIWQGIDLSRHFCQFYFWKLPAPEFIDLVINTFKYVHLNIDVCSLSESNRKKLESLGIVKPQPTDAEIFSFFDACESYENVDVKINQIAGVPYFSSQETKESNHVLARLIHGYSCFGGLDWGRLHAQPGAPIIKTCEDYGMISYATSFADFLHYSELNLEEVDYPDITNLNYPYIYWKDDHKNAEISRYYFETEKKIRENQEQREESLTVTRTESYQGLNDEAEQLAGQLRQRGIRAGDIVALMVEDPFHTALGILGILKTGAAYLPIDPGHPEERISYMLSDSGAEILLTSRDLGDKFQGRDRFKTCPYIELIDECRGEQRSPPHLHLPPAPATGLAYVIYTSGTTGQPKGVLVDHRSAVNTLFYRKQVYKMDSQTTALQLFSPSFDGFVTSFFTPIISGAKVVLLAKKEIRDIARIKEVIQYYRVTHFISVPALYQAIIENLSAEEAASLKVVTLAGDRLSPTLLALTRHKNQGMEIVNEYGVTEAAVMSTLFSHQENDDYIKIGAPIGNTRIYILEEQYGLQPIGAIGELCISGVGVARGYLNNPALTAEKFIPVPAFTQHPQPEVPSGTERSEARLYRTGDLARWLPDGNIEFFGRIDQQIKIRGFRIELGEIESQLIKHRDVKETVLICRSDKSGDKYLCAYIVGSLEKTPGSTELREYLAHRLPDYMIPSYFIPLDEIPLTPNGKIDVKALPGLEMKAVDNYTSPRNRVEEKLVRIWAEVLGRDALPEYSNQDQFSPIGIDDNFFELGGHSLKATILVSKIHKALNTKVPLAEIFKTPTIRGLSKYIQKSVKDKFAALGVIEKKDYYSSSPGQKRLYFLQQMDVESTAYNALLALTFEDGLDKERLETTFKKIIARHESLRTSFIMLEESPVQQVRDNVELSIEYFEGDVYDIQRIINNFVRPFDLSQAPLLRLGIVKSTDGKDIMMIDIHHIITDGASQSILSKEFMALYTGAEVPMLEFQHKDYSEWQQSRDVKEAVKQQETYWLEKFSGEIPVLNLPTDYPRPVVQSFEGDSIGFELSGEKTSTLIQLARSGGATLFMVLLAVYNILLARLSNQEDIIVGTPTAGRKHIDLENIVGMFVNTLALRNYPSGNKTFREFLKEVRERTLEAFENQEYQFEDIVEKVAVQRDVSRNPLFDSMFVLQNMFDPSGGVKETEMGGVKMEPYAYEHRTSKFDLSLTAGERGYKLYFSFTYCTRLFKKESILRFIKYFEAIISALTESPGMKLSGIEIISGEEKQRVLYDFNNTEAPYPQNKTLHELFQDEVERTPGHTAVVFEDKHLTYGKLNSKANQLARLLREKGVKRTGIVGLILERSLEMIIAILAVLKAHAAYLPISPEYPEARKKFILEDSAIELLLTNEQQRQENRDKEVCREIPPWGILSIDEPTLYTCPENMAENIDKNRPGDLAYIIYTSGSTGIPKGVMIEHRSVVNLVEAFKERVYRCYKYTINISLVSPYTFDASIKQIFPALLLGHTLVIVPEGARIDGEKLIAFYKNKDIQVADGTPAHIRMLLNYKSQLGERFPVEQFIAGGEELETALCEQFTAAAGKKEFKIINVYGPTECCDVTTSFTINQGFVNDCPDIPIGTPLGNIKTYILGPCGELQPIGSPGELHIAGAGLGRGYLNNPALTAEKFTGNPFAGGEKVYRSGDLARWLPQGSIGFLGRSDHQVKVRGFRIEPGEIENQLLRNEKIKEAVVISRNSFDSCYLCAYFVPADDAAPSISVSELKEYLLGKLPGYMIPTFFVLLKNIPLTSNGKIDRRALPEPDGDTGQGYIPPRSETESILARIWRDVLKLERIGIRDNYFNLGGDSIKAIKLLSLINGAFNSDLKIADLFINGTIEKLSTSISQGKSDRPPHRDTDEAFNETLKEIEELKNHILFETAAHIAAEIEDIYPMSDIEKGMVFHSLKEPERAIYHDQIIHQLTYADFNVERFKKALVLMTEKHQILRTSFFIGGVAHVQEAVQIVHKAPAIDFKHYDISYMNRGEQEEWLKQFMLEDRRNPFAVSVPPLWRMGAFARDKDNIVFLWVCHHAIMDGWSDAAFKTELNNTYLKLQAEPGFFPGKLKSSYKEFVVEQLANKKKREVVDYWRNELADYKRLEFPGIGKREGERKRYSANLGLPLLNRLNDAALKLHTSLKHLVFAAYMYMLGMWSYENDFTAGLVVNNRPLCEDGEKILGCFLNTVPVRLYIPANITWSDYIGMVDRKLVELARYDRLSLFEIVKVTGEVTAGQNPIFDTLFNFVDFHVFQDVAIEGDQRNLPGSAAENRLAVSGQITANTLFDFTIDTTLGGFRIGISYSGSLLSDETVLHLCQYFKAVLLKFIHEPGIIAAKEQLLGQEEKQKLLNEFNNTTAEYPVARTMHELFEEQANRTPDYTALIGSSLDAQNVQLIYKELDERSSQLARLLTAKGAAPDTIVALMSEHSIEMIIAILGILKAGAAYLPIDPEYPHERIGYMLSDSGAKILLTSRDLGDKFQDGDRFKTCPTIELIDGWRCERHSRSHLHRQPAPATCTGRWLPATALAYVIYTSGTTGRPKGVVVDHRGAVNTLHYRTQVYEMDSNAASLQLFSPSFDGFVTSFFTPILCGAKVVLLDKEAVRDVKELKEAIQKHKISHFIIVPALYQAVIESLTPGEAKTLKAVTLAGDKLTPTLLALTRSKNQDLEIVNEYGVTEASVMSTIYRNQEKDSHIKIGAPVWNTKIYILDRWGCLQPIGVAGELCISGVGAARGYLNQPELTAEKFMVNPFSPRFSHPESGPTRLPRGDGGLETLYRTGDFARWLPDGNIEFLGRIDHQVKIRGYRIELGEIEKQLLEYDKIKEAVVIERGDAAGNRFLCAYVVLHSPWSPGPLHAPISSGLREYLSRQLPGYMIPAFFVELERIPLNPNGKIDRKALPATEFAGTLAAYEAPGNEIEEKLLEVWSQVLDREEAGHLSIGINDNFFDLGGDSIKAIQISSRLRTYGLELKINDLFNHPLIKDLAKYVRRIERAIAQGIVVGEVPLTPIQRWFFDHDFTAKHHFNQAVMLYRKEGFDEEILKKVFTKIVTHHDALRMVYEINREEHGEVMVVQRNRGIEGKLFNLKIFDFKDIHAGPLIEKEIAREAERIQSSVDLEKGPLVRLGLFKTNGGDHLLIVIHHLVIDGISWRILFEDIGTNCRQSEQGQEISFLDKTDSFQYWSKKLTEYASRTAGAAGEKALKELEYWRTLESVKIETLPGKHEVKREHKRQRYTDSIVLDLDQAGSECLLRKVNRAYNTEINDILLTALGLAVRHWAGLDKVLIELEGHGRESIIKDIDVSRTVGWFTTQYPVILDMGQSEDLCHAIKYVKETLRRIPNKGIGYGILKYLIPEERGKGIIFALKPEISFNYLGQFDQLHQESNVQAQTNPEFMQFSWLSAGKSISPELEQTHALAINGMVAGGKLVLSFAFNTYEYDRACIESLVKGVKSNLLRIIRHCSEKQEKELTPSDVMDVAYLDISLQEFSRITNHIMNYIPGSPVIEAIYPLSPMQTGMLYHSLTRKGYDVYVIQSVFKLAGEIEASLLESSFNQLIERYDIFRTVFIYEGLAEPVQALLKQRRVQVYVEDITDLDETGRTLYLEEFVSKDRERGFDLSKDVLMRLSLFKTGVETHCLVWSYHHILMDGWCIGIIYNDLINIYRWLKEGQTRPLEIKAAAPYKNYIEWLERQDKVSGLHYWGKYLEGFAEPTGLAGVEAGKLMREGSYKLEECTLELSLEETIVLNQIAGKNQVTINTLFQALWGILLQKYNDCSDVVFGAVVSGRPPEVEGIEDMVGLFINTVPVRMESQPGMEFSQLLKTLQEHSTSAKPYEYSPLAEIQANSLLKANLIDHIMVFENYPINEQLKDAGTGVGQGMAIDFKLEDVNVFEQTNYNLNLVIIPQKPFLVRFSYNALVYEKDFINRVGLHLKEIIKHIKGNLDTTVGEVAVVTENEKQQILFEFNRAPSPYPQDKTIHQLFAEQAARTPHHIAVISMGHGVRGTEARGEGPPPKQNIQLTYRELNENSNRLAQILIERGVHPDTIVGIMVERSAEMIIGILGILKACAGYLPIDPEYPQERIQYMLSDTGAGMLLTDDVKVRNRFKTCPSNESDTITIHDVTCRGESMYSSETNVGTRDVMPLHLHLPPAPATALAYIIYTSGTTGRPKGVAVPHSAFVNRLYCLQEHYHFGEQDVILQKTRLTFDVSVCEIFRGITWGAVVAVADKEIEKDVGKLIRAIGNYKVTVVEFVPPLLEVFLDYLDTHGVDFMPAGLRLVFVGGEVVGSRLVKRFNERFYVRYGIKLVNAYGPTETTVDVTWYDCNSTQVPERIPIGTPIANTQVYILDKNNRLQPVGVKGELCIAGESLARGYLNQSELTAQKFISAPASSIQPQPEEVGGTERSEARLYRTGDLARWLPDGNVEFLGRIDNQVKVRGFRIELEEIENLLLLHPQVSAAAAAVRESSTGDPRLCAYVVLVEKYSLTQATDLKEYLSRQLPPYMIPAYFVEIEKVPLKPNGKVAREALPDPGIGVSTADYVPPGNKTAEKLVEIWQEVLGQKQVGITDNFFEIGGDSIKAMQISSRLRKYGLDVKIGDLFLHPIIKELTPYVTKIGRSIPQGIVSGEVPLTPIQRWFFEHDFSGKHHFNQAVMLYREEGFAEEILREVFTKLVEHHDALRMVYENSRSRGKGCQEPVIQRNRGLAGRLFELEIFDFKDEAPIEKEIARETARIQGSIDLETGPLVKLALFKTCRGDHLLIAVHHLVIDGISWRILLEDFSTGYRQMEQGQKIEFQQKTDSFRLWSQKLDEYAADMGARQRQYQYWQTLETQPAETGHLPRDHKISAERKTAEYIDILTLNLNEAETGNLLAKVNRAYNTEINDILLTALGMAVKQWAGKGKVLIELEGHGREPIIEDINISRTVGWFTSQYPVILDMSQAEDISYAIKSVKETLRRIPNRGIDYGILKYLIPAEERGCTFNLEPDISFNYLGQFGQEMDPENAEFIQFSWISSGKNTSLEMEQTHALAINGMVAGGKLILSFAYNIYEFDKASIETLVKGVKSNLLRIIQHCSRKQEKELTPSDVMDAGYLAVSLEEFSRITNHIQGHIAGNPALESIYPLSPMQTGMLYHSLASEDNYDVYLVQSFFKLHGEIEKSLLESSFNRLIERYDIFRTIVIYEGLTQPLQILLKQRKVQVYHEDIADLEEAERTYYLDAFVRKDRERGFDLGKDILMRLSLFKTGANSYHLLWSYHHILMDGWCVGIIYKEFLQIYRWLKEAKPIRLEAAAPYKNYIEWLQKQDKAVGLHYWEKYLEGFDRQTGLQASRPGKPIREVGYKLHEYTLELSQEETLSLNQTAGKNRVTINTVFQTLWGILLQKYNNSSDVVFGAVVAGRPSELKGIESMVGLFINTVPVRLKSRAHQQFSRLLRTLQEDSLSSRSYEYLSLADIQSISELKANLIDHIMIFENYPLEEQLMGINTSLEQGAVVDFQVENIKLYEQTNYHFNVIIFPGKHFLVKFSYNALVYDHDFVNRVGRHVRQIIKQVKDNPRLAVQEIEILTEDERQRVIFEFNRTAVPYPQDRTIHHIFEEQVERTPQHIAVIGMGHGTWGIVCNGEGPSPNQNIQLTYRELNEKSNRLVHILIERGVRPDTIVGIMVERSAAMIIGILGILKGGGAYLPIDPEYPAERIKYMLSDSGAKILLTSRDLGDKFQDGDRFKTCPTIELIDGWRCERYSRSHLHRPPAPATALAYIIYTSGTTGRPKGVMIQHRSVLNLIKGMTDIIDFHPGGRVLSLTTICFDIFVLETTIPLTRGTTVVMGTRDEQVDVELAASIIDREKVTIFQLTPARLHLFLSHKKAARSLKNLQYLLVGGEAFPEHLLEETRAMVRGKIINLYGPTETTVWSTAKDLSGQTPLTIGTPIANTQIYIVDNYLKFVPAGMVGEIYIAGDGVARGYVNSPELTTEKFMPAFHYAKSTAAPGNGAKLYRTGDLARWLFDGNIEFLGRIDHQVKVRGYRIELGEIENQLLNHEDVRGAAVIDWKDNEGDTSLCAYVVPKAAGADGLEVSRLRDYLAGRLPAYMIPAFFVQLAEIPLTRNGKLDRKRLPMPQAARAREHVPPQTQLEKELVNIFCQVLNVERIGLEDDFFTLGGDSLKLIKLVAKIQEVFNVHVPLTQLFNNPQVKDISEHILFNKFKADEEEIGVLLTTAKTGTLFCFPPLVGYGIAYMEFSLVLEDYSVYAFNFIDDPKPLEKYVDTILKIQPQGPYVLFAYSAGGILCLKTAEILEKRGYQVSDIILMECSLDMADLDIKDFEEYEEVKELFAGIRNALSRLGADALSEKVVQKIKKYYEFLIGVKGFEKVKAALHFIKSGDKNREKEPINLRELTAGKHFIYPGFGKHQHMIEPRYIEKNIRIIKKILAKEYEGEKQGARNGSTIS